MRLSHSDAPQSLLSQLGEEDERLAQAFDGLSETLVAIRKSGLPLEEGAPAREAPFAVAPGPSLDPSADPIRRQISSLHLAL